MNLVDYRLDHKYHIGQVVMDVNPNTPLYYGRIAGVFSNEFLLYVNFIQKCDNWTDEECPVYLINATEPTKPCIQGSMTDEEYAQVPMVQLIYSKEKWLRTTEELIED